MGALRRSSRCVRAGCCVVGQAQHLLFISQMLLWFGECSQCRHCMLHILQAAGSFPAGFDGACVQCSAEPSKAPTASVQWTLTLGARPVRRARRAHAERGAARAAQELASRGYLDAFVNGARDERVLTVVAVTATSVGACVRVFPAVVALAKSFAGYATFGRLLYDAGPEAGELAAELNVKQVRGQHAIVSPACRGPGKHC